MPSCQRLQSQQLVRHINSVNCEAGYLLPGSPQAPTAPKLAKLRKPLHSLTSSLQSKHPHPPLQAQAPTTPTPTPTAPTQPWSALTKSGQRGVPRAIRPTVGREVHHSQDTRSTHKTQSRKEESRDRGRDWTHSRHQRRAITANAESYNVRSWENDISSCESIFLQ